MENPVLIVAFEANIVSHCITVEYWYSKLRKIIYNPMPVYLEVSFTVINGTYCQITVARIDA